MEGRWFESNHSLTLNQYNGGYNKMSSCEEVKETKEKRKKFTVILDIQAEEKRNHIVKYLREYDGYYGSAMFNQLANIIERG